MLELECTGHSFICFPSELHTFCGTSDMFVTNQTPASLKAHRLDMGCNTASMGLNSSAVRQTSTALFVCADWKKEFYPGRQSRIQEALLYFVVNVYNKCDHEHRCLAFQFWQKVISFALFPHNSALPEVPKQASFSLPVSLARWWCLICKTRLPFKRSATAKSSLLWKKNSDRSGHWHASSVLLTFVSFISQMSRGMHLSSTMHKLSITSNILSLPTRRVLCKL